MGPELCGSTAGSPKAWPPGSVFAHSALVRASASLRQLLDGQLGAGKGLAPEPSRSQRPRTPPRPRGLLATQPWSSSVAPTPGLPGNGTRAFLPLRPAMWLSVRRMVTLQPLNSPDLWASASLAMKWVQ
ncbi:hypothetical protein J1605_022499 [Eschrichtius robustus]|uniref:Uncharacterized protein n=1 Tax=Eschrichtius robustus TaxID=9764 RepID=A0AB34H6K8_ESCRO|nr:hypothetical protein J1605_022499 [Eschrichtius robustus]